MAVRTKYILAESFQKILKEKPLEKITIQDITEDCKMNRQTFYYHFHDIYDLIEWIYVTNAISSIADNRKYDNWQEGLTNLSYLMLENKDFITKTYHSPSCIHLQKMIVNRVHDLLVDVIQELCQSENLHPVPNIELIANFFKYSFAGMLTSWIEDDMKQDPQILIQKVDCMMQGILSQAVVNMNQFQVNG